MLVAHPDDEAVGCGNLLQRMQDPIVVYATDGAPRSEYFWSKYGSREGYAARRLREAEEALERIGLQHFHLLDEENTVADQELFLNVDCAYSALADVVECELPEAILTLAYEGGHPDHDTCSFLASICGKAYELPVWEMPLYHRSGEVVQRQRFIAPSGVEITPTLQELKRKQAMFAAYASQANVLAEFDVRSETVRPAKEYDFSQPPHTGTLNYEAWQWPMRGSDLCRAFTSFLNKPSSYARKREWGTAA